MLLEKLSSILLLMPLLDLLGSPLSVAVILLLTPLTTSGIVSLPLLWGSLSGVTLRRRVRGIVSLVVPLLLGTLRGIALLGVVSLLASALRTHKRARNQEKVLYSLGEEFQELT